jgi:hypothetical protein
MERLGKYQNSSVKVTGFKIQSRISEIKRKEKKYSIVTSDIWGVKIKEYQ